MTARPNDRLQDAVDAGIRGGLLPAGVQPTPSSERPWPVILLTALGVWFGAVPLLIAIGLLLGDLVRAGVGPYVVGCLLLGAATVVMRSRTPPLFVEQLAALALLVGGGTLAMGLYRDFHRSGGSAILLAVVVLLALLLSKTWLRVLLGALAAGLLANALLPNWFSARNQGTVLLVLHGMLAVWLLSLWLQQRVVSLAAMLEAMAAGWLLTTLAGLTWMSGATFLVGGAVGSNAMGAMLGWIAGFERHSWQASAIQTGASALVLAGAGVGALAWPTLRQRFPLAVALVLAALAWFMPLLGGVLLALMVTVTTRRWRLASACALAAIWIMGAFYYQLRWPLAEKALLLVGAGVLLGGLAWMHLRAATLAAKPAGNSASPSGWRSVRALAMLAGALLTLMVANLAIWQKQDLIARGKPVFMALLPADPRSLMQGDYMRLRFSALDGSQLPLLDDLRGKRPHMVVRLDDRGVATLQRWQTAGQALASDEMLLELTPKDGAWVVVTDAWFFKEGQGQRWQAAKFGEFRVLPDGQALLVGMADANLQPIAPGPP